MMPLIQKVQKLMHRHMSSKAMQRRNLVEPTRDWLIGLASLVILFVCGVSYVVFDFYTQVDVSYESIEVTVEAISYPERDVIYYADQYQKKEAYFNQLRGIKYESAPQPEAEVIPLAEDLVAQ